MQTQTINEVIGSNLRRMRTAEVLTLAEAAGALELLSGRTFSEAKMSRWETGQYNFTVTDLHLLSQVYGVNIIALLKPADDVTHIQVDQFERTPEQPLEGELIEADSYVYDFFIDPAGRWTERARRWADRRSEGATDVVDALNEVEDRLGDRAGLADFLATVNAAARLRSETAEAAAARERLIAEPSHHNLDEYLDVARWVNDRGGAIEIFDEEIERIINGLAQEDE